MKFLVVGLGSMGKRRVRNLQALGHRDIVGVDARLDRRQEAESLYRIDVCEDWQEAIATHSPEAVVISVPPQHHMHYAWLAVDRGLPCFIEASVVEADRILKLARHISGSAAVVAPSCTMRYFPGPREVKKLIQAGMIGKPLNFDYQTGQYLPDWHPWESIEEYYVSARATGGCREIVPFELTWLNDIFGEPEPLACVKSKLTDINADIDDIYHCILRYPSGLLANISVDVISRPNATRTLRILGSEGIIHFDSDEQCVRYCNLANKGEWLRLPLSKGNAQQGYINPEEPYIAEMGDFVAAAEARNPQLFPNTLEADWRVLQALVRLEELSEHRR